MKVKHVLLIVAGVACVAGGFLLAQRLASTKLDASTAELRQASQREQEALRADAANWAGTLAAADGESLLKAFVAGISPAVAAQRRETVELAAAALLRISGVAGIHVLGTDGSVLYSSDAKLSTTGEAQYRGSWALQATEIISQPGSRPGITDFAMPIASGGNRIAVAWLEYDLARVRDAARPASLGDATADEQPAAVQPSSSSEDAPLPPAEAP